jgi:hypothetical protein
VTWNRFPANPVWRRPSFDQDQESSEPLDLATDERRLVTQPYDFSIASLIEDIDSGRLLLELEYQRSYVWDDAKASRLIESLWREVLALVRRAIAPGRPWSGHAPRRILGSARAIDVASPPPASRTRRASAVRDRGWRRRDPHQRTHPDGDQAVASPPRDGVLFTRSGDDPLAARGRSYPFPRRGSSGHSK